MTIKQLIGHAMWFIPLLIVLSLVITVNGTILFLQIIGGTIVVVTYICVMNALIDPC